MSRVPSPSARVLAEFDVPALVRLIGPTATPLARAFGDLERAQEAHAAALTAVDRIEAALIAAHGYPRVALPAAVGAAQTYAADPATITRALGRGLAARRLTTALRRRQRRFALAAEAAGLERAQDEETRAHDRLGAATTSLLIAPVTSLTELRLKLVVLIAAGEAGPPEASAFPWVFLRTVLADLRSLGSAREAI